MSAHPLFKLYIALLVVALSPAVLAQTVESKVDAAPAQKEEAAAEVAEIPLDFRSLEGRQAVAPETLDKPASRLPGGLALRDIERPGREAPPTPVEEKSSAPPAGGDLESNPVESRRGGGRDGRDDRDRRRPDYDLYEEASRAAEWAAQWQVRRYGLPEYYRVGAWQGLRDAFERAARRRGAFDRGLDDGERDPRALRTGRQAGEKAAFELGEKAALREIEREFHDLSREPRRNVRPPEEAMPADLIRVRAPRPEDVFSEMPIGPYLDWENYDRYTDAWQLYRCTSYSEVFDDDWDSDRRAFDHWRDRGDDRSLWKRLSRQEQDYFRRTFVKQLDYWRHRFLRSGADRAYAAGYDHGWDYGSRLGSEMRYREGYHQGFLGSARREAEDVWYEAFPDTFERVYRDEYTEWMGSPRPEITRVDLLDRNDDTIFEPGEEVLVQVELANYGGREVSLELGADGAAIEPAAAARPVMLQRRDTAKAEVRVVVDRGQAPRTSSSFQVRAGHLSRMVPILISRPLEIDGRVDLREISSLEGRVTFEAIVVNRSTKAAAGSLDVWASGRRIPGQSLELIGPQGRRPVRVELEGLEVLGLLEGSLELRLELRGRDIVHDELRQRLPAQGLDLRSDELVRFWVEALAGERSLDRAETRRAVELIAQRLAADWEIQWAASGNPYKEDLQQGGRRTALGELVAAVKAARPAPRGSELPRALDTRLRALVEELPGTHPFLRSAFKKLAGELL